MKSVFPGHVAQAAALLLAVLLGILLLGPMKAEADRRAEVLKNTIISRIEEEAGVTVFYSGISPALLSAVSIRNLHVSFPGGDADADVLRVFYNPFRMFFREDMAPVDMITRILIDGGHLNLNLVELPAGKTAEPGADQLTPWTFLAGKILEGRRLSASIRGDRDLAVDAASLSFRLEGTAEEIQYRIKSAVNASETQNLAFLGAMETRLSSQGRFLPSSSEANGRLGLESFFSDAVVLGPLYLDFTFSPGGLTARRVGDARPLDLALKINENGEWDIQGEAENLSIDSIVRPGETYGSLSQWTSTVLDGRFSISGPILNYQADMAAAIPRQAIGKTLRAEISAEGNADILQIASSRLSASEGSLSFAGSVKTAKKIPEGRLSVNINEHLFGYPASARFVLSETAGVLSAQTESAEFGPLGFRDVKFLAVQEDPSWILSLLVVPELSSENKGGILVDAVVSPDSDTLLRGFLSAENLDASPLLAAAGVGQSLPVPDMRLDAGASFELSLDSWLVVVDHLKLSDRLDSSRGLAMRGKAFPNRWSLDAVRVSWGNILVDGRAQVRQDNYGEYRADGRLVYGDNIYPFQADWSSDGELNINSDFGLSASVGPEFLTGRTVLVQAADVLLPIEDSLLRMNVDLRGRIKRRDWDFYINTARLAWERPEKRPLVLDAYGSFRSTGADLLGLTFDDGFGTLEGRAVLIRSESGETLRGRIYLDSGDGESYEISADTEGGTWDAGWNIRSARLKRFLPERLDGRLSLTGRLKGRLDAPLVSLELGTEDAVLDGERLEIYGAASLENQRLSVRDLRYAAGGYALERGLVLANLESGSLRATAGVRVLSEDVPLTTGFTLALDMPGGFPLSPSVLLGQDFNGTLSTRPILWDEREHFPEYSVNFSREESVFTAVSSDGETLDFFYDSESTRLDIETGPRLPVVVKGGGTVGNGAIDLSLPRLSIDPLLINYAMPKDPILDQYHVVFQAGRFTGSLHISGSADNPDFKGLIRAEDLQVDTPYTYAEVGRVNTTITLDGKRITLGRIQVPIGDAYLYGGGYLELERWTLTEFNMVYGAMASDRAEGVPIYYPLLKINLDGLFTGECRMTGDGRQFFLEGTFTFPFLKASPGTSKAPQQSGSGNLKGDTPVFLDFDFITGNNCTFFLPNEQLKIVQATAEPGSVVSLDYSHVPQSLSVSGTLPVKSGTIYYFDRDFRVTRGEFRMNESLESFNPILGFRAETRIRDTSGEDVNVALVYEAPIQSDFNPRIETSPVKTEQEILALFGRVVSPYSEGGDASTVLLATGGVFAQFGIVQPFEEVLREGLNLDIVTIRTDIIENTLAEGFARSNSSGSTSASSLGRYLDNTSLFAGKYIGNAVFISGMVTANSFEGQRNLSVFGGLGFEFAVNLEMKTPFFDIAWSYSPDSLTNQNFVADNEISLKWQFSY